MLDNMTGLASGYAPLIINAAKALLVLVLGWILSGFASRTVKRRFTASPRIDDTIGSFAASIIRWLVLLITLIAVLNLFGIQATSLVAMLGAATLAIGMALQGTLADLAAGFMIVLFRPYRIGQYVEISGTSGTVLDINLFFTELATPDNVQIIVPNGKAWGAIITNYSHHDTRRVDLTFGIGYDDDPGKAMDIIRKIAAADSRVHDDPDPWLRVTNLGDSAVEITARIWVAAPDYWDVKFELTRAVKEAFDAEGITIPYPHRVMVQATG
ncbi:mechanosensitive ion channel family protein [Sinisalibacter lacisalsi]|uniref:Small-conductance mechanosensitive channel n=1 Tax=Sinisalibacter lacisalsi TaxID=1526570 RepID=A0ABQ1QEV6_9RHOB|nr:mechanosensitive ion channel protein [Sinisalibacter lacisalsi]